MPSSSPVGVGVGVDADPDAAIACLENLITSLEDAQLGDLSAALAAASTVSAAVVGAAVAAPERAAWLAEADNALEALQCGERVCGKREGEASGEKKRKMCVHGCGVGYCSAACWRAGRRKHEGECQVIYRRRALAKIGLGGGKTAGEMF